jgi:hypothetical protein
MPCIAILNKQKCLFFFHSFIKSKKRRAEQVLSVGVGTSERREEVGKW